MKLNLNFIGKVKRKSEFEKYYTVICVIIINSRVLKDINDLNGKCVPYYCQPHWWKT